MRKARAAGHRGHGGGMGAAPIRGPRSVGARGRAFARAADFPPAPRSTAFLNGLAGLRRGRGVVTISFMIRVMRHGARWGAVLVAIGLLVGPVGFVDAAEPDDEELEGTEDEEVEGTEDVVEQPKDEVAQVKIEIKLESGRVVKPENNFTVDYGVDSNLEIQADGAKHQFLLNIKRKGDKNGKAKKDEQISITVGYDRDGEAIIAPYTFDAKVKKREVLRIEGGVAIAFVITPKKVESADAPKEEELPEELPEEKPRDKKKKIETCKDDDPLCGAK